MIERFVLMMLIAVPALTTVGCATQSGARAHVATLGGAQTRVVELPGPAEEGPPRQVSVLVDEPALKLASIVLRGGTVLPAHSADVPVTIMALEGSGTVVVGEERHRLDRTHAVVLGPDVMHAVEPDPDTDLVLLVHHLGRPQEHHQ